MGDRMSCYILLSPVSTGMGDRMSCYVSAHSGMGVVKLRLGELPHCKGALNEHFSILEGEF